MHYTNVENSKKYTFSNLKLNSTGHPKKAITRKEAQCELAYISPIRKVAVNSFLK